MVGVTNEKCGLRLRSKAWRPTPILISLLSFSVSMLRSTGCNERPIAQGSYYQGCNNSRSPRRSTNAVLSNFAFVDARLVSPVPLTSNLGTQMP